MIRSLFYLTLPLILVAPTAAPWQPTGSLEELYDDTLLPRLRPGVSAAMFSSYDRTGGNDDGFSGTYSKIREENGNSVVAEMEGPGCIYRMWMTHSAMEEPGLLDRKGEHIRVYLDGNEKPALDVPIEDLFNGSLDHFPKPLAGEGIGGYYSYIPIPYKKSCKVVIDGLGVRFYQYNYVTFPSADGVENFTLDLTANQKKALGNAVSLWTDPLGQLQSKNCTRRTVEIDDEAKAWKLEPIVIEGETGLTFVHGITLEGVTEEVIQSGSIEISVPGTAPGSFHLPLDLFFGRAFDAVPFESLLFGSRGTTYYNKVPFVYEGQCTIRLTSKLPVQGVLTVYQSKSELPASAFGELHAQVNSSFPTVPGVYHPFLTATGQGHYAGTYMVTEGPAGLPFWLEGDDRWTLDGALSIHGTGSEDYFNCGWYALKGRLNGPEALPTHGFPTYNLTESRMRAAAFRWHFSDPIPFDESIDAVIEHGEQNLHIANYRSAAYYYLAR